MPSVLPLLDQITLNQHEIVEKESRGNQIQTSLIGRLLLCDVKDFHQGWSWGLTRSGAAPTAAAGVLVCRARDPRLDLISILDDGMCLGTARLERRIPN
jgi:hypothetical protein